MYFFWCIYLYFLPEPVITDDIEFVDGDDGAYYAAACDTESGLVHQCFPCVCLSVCLSPKCKKNSDFLKN